MIGGHPGVLRSGAGLTRDWRPSGSVTFWGRPGWIGRVALHLFLLFIETLARFCEMESIVHYLMSNFE